MEMGGIFFKNLELYVLYDLGMSCAVLIWQLLSASFKCEIFNPTSLFVTS